jgi:hypothetical protein
MDDEPDTLAGLSGWLSTVLLTRPTTVTVATTPPTRMLATVPTNPTLNKKLSLRFSREL